MTRFVVRSSLRQVHHTERGRYSPLGAAHYRQAVPMRPDRGCNHRACKGITRTVTGKRGLPRARAASPDTSMPRPVHVALIRAVVPHVRRHNSVHHGRELMKPVCDESALRGRVQVANVTTCQFTAKNK